MNLPQDVYSGIAEVVERQRKQDADSGVLIAQILEGHIKRKVLIEPNLGIVHSFRIKRNVKNTKLFQEFQIDAGSIASEYAAAKEAEAS